MKKQKEEAERYATVQEKRKELQQRLFLLRLFNVEKEVASKQAQLEEVSATFDEASARHSTAEDEVKEYEKEKAALSRKSTELERKVVQLQQQMEGKSPATIKLREEMNHVQRRKAMHGKSLEKISAAHAAAQEEMAQLESEYAQVSEAVARLEDEHAGAEERGELELSKQQRDEYNRLKQEAGAKTAAVKEQMAAKKRELRSEDHTLLQLRTRTTELEKEEASVHDKLSAFAEHQSKSEERATELRDKVEQLKTELGQLRSGSSQARERHTELTAEVARARETLRSSKAEQRESERDRKAQEALENLMRHFPGVHGRMLEVCKPTQRKYNQAVTVAMGKNMESIVVDEEKTAKDCIRYLKEKKCAPETFVPLDTIRVAPIAERMRQLGGTKRPIVDVVVPNDERFVRAVQYAVGDAVVCDSLDEARKLAYHSKGSERYKVVTIDGTLINKAGLMTGGSGSGDAQRAGRWNQHEYDQLKAREAECAKELETIGSLHRAAEKEQQMAHRLESKQQELKMAATDLDVTRGKAKKLTSDMKAVRSERAKADAELTSLLSKRAAQEAEVQALQERADKEEDRVFSKFSKSLKLGSVRDYEEKQLREAKEKEARLLELKTQQGRLQSKLNFEKKKDLPGAMRKLQASVASDAELLSEKEKEKAKLEEKTDKLKEQATKVEEEAKEAKALQEAKLAELKQLRKALKASGDESSKAKARVAQLEGELEQQRSQRQRTFHAARMAEVKLPLLKPGEEPEGAPAAGGGGGGGGGGEAGGGAAAKGKRKRGSAGGSSSAGAGGSSGDLLASESFSAHGLVGTQTLEGADEGGGASSSAAAAGGGGEADELVRIDFSSLDARSREAAASRAESEATHAIDEAAAELEGMAPNMKALQQYDEVLARLHSMEGLCDSSLSKAKTVRQQFELVKAKREACFMKMFGKVSKEIDGNYKDLTQVEGVPLGGTAYLSLEDTSDPFLHGITYHAMPPSKRFRSMDQLSGGERTLAALALLFSIHQYRPSPFFVMDEIDAALDNVNVTRVADFIRERSEENGFQFVVISLKDNFYEKANGLVGILRDRDLECSRSVTLNLDELDGVEA